MGTEVTVITDKKELPHVKDQLGKDHQEFPRRRYIYTFDDNVTQIYHFMFTNKQLLVQNTIIYWY